jgi:predicted nucleotide-binding protein
LTLADTVILRDRKRRWSRDQPRGRQNVIFELGFFFGKLGRERVCVLLAGGVEEPSDIAGLVYITIDAGGAWKYQLARELTAADIRWP